MTTTAPARVMTIAEAATEMTFWFDDATWYPFVEDENGLYTGPGHQDQEAFAASVNAYVAQASGADSQPITASDVSHLWGVATYDEHGQWRCWPVPEGTPDALPVTAIWDL